MNIVKGLCIVLSVFLSGCTSPSRPGAPVKDEGKFYGCYSVGSNLSVILNSKSINIFGTRYNSEILKDKWGVFVFTKTAFWIKNIDGSFEVAAAKGESSLIRIWGDRDYYLEFTTKAGEAVRAHRSSC